DGTELAYESAESTGAGDIMVRDLTTGSQRTIDPSISATFEDALSWSPYGAELLISGAFLSTPPKTWSSGTLPNLFTDGVQLLALNQPLSTTNPHFLGTPVDSSGVQGSSPTWSDAQFVGSAGEIVVVQSGSGGDCQAAPSSILSVDPASGTTTTIASFSYLISDP